MLMPSHARNVQLYKDDTPIFARNGVEAQLDAMFSPQVTLRSGGYIVINQTEALVSIDVNSGRSTREHSIEDTALNTNLEAAEEIARQLRLRDLAGLIVIDFIDMEEKRNNRSVERKLKDCLRADRARIQVGRISHFGLMEMSRQRIRTGVLESSTVPCPHCRGTGQVRSISSLSLQILRALEDQLLRHSGHHLLVRTRPEVALYVLNQKRRHLAQLEERFGLTITVSGEAPENGAGFTVERGAPVEDRPERSSAIAMREMAPPPRRASRRKTSRTSERRGGCRKATSDLRRRDGRRGPRTPPPRRRRRGGNGDDRHERAPARVEAVRDADDRSRRLRPTEARRAPIAVPSTGETEWRTRDAPAPAWTPRRPAARPRARERRSSGATRRFEADAARRRAGEATEDARAACRTRRAPDDAEREPKSERLARSSDARIGATATPSRGGRGAEAVEPERRRSLSQPRRPRSASARAGGQPAEAQRLVEPQVVVLLKARSAESSPLCGRGPPTQPSAVRGAQRPDRTRAASSPPPHPTGGEASDSFSEAPPTETAAAAAARSSPPGRRRCSCSAAPGRPSPSPDCRAPR